MSEFKVFYSWQSDLPNKTNRGFIHDALVEACKEIGKDSSVEDSPRLDQDTLGLPGSPAIPEAILRKVDECDCFVADVSLCYDGPKGKRAPNPNVLFELGYAVARLTWDRVILVVNTAYGPIEDLPFDLDKRRAVPFSAKEEETDRATPRGILAKTLGKGITAIMSLGVRAQAPPEPTVFDDAIHAIEAQLPARISKVRKIWPIVIAEIEAAATQYQENLSETILVETLPNAMPTVTEFCRVALAASECNDQEAALALFAGFEQMLERYDLPAVFSGSYSEQEFDYWRFVGRQMATYYFACLLKERRWAAIKASMQETFIQKRWLALGREGSNDYRALDLFPHSIYYWNEQRNPKYYSPIGQLMKQSHESSNIESFCTWSELCDADFLLGLASYEPTDTWSSGWWYPMTFPDWRQGLQIRLRMRNAKFAIEVVGLLGLPGIPKLQENMNSMLNEIIKTNRGSFFQLDTSTSDIGSA